MDQSKIDDYKAKLEKQRAELMKAFQKDETPEDFGSDTDHLEEEASETEAADNRMAAGAGLKERINEIDMALNKMRMGKFGICEKCGNKAAYYWTQQTRGADEPETRFFKCTKCEYTWREYA